MLVTSISTERPLGNSTSNLYKDLVNYFGIPEPLLITILVVSVLVLLLFVLLCLRCLKRCCSKTNVTDSYGSKMLKTKDIDKIFSDKVDFDFNEGFGKIHFSMKYNFPKELLIIKIIQVCGLPRPIDGTLDPYIKILVKLDFNIEEKCTKTKMKTIDPVFNEKFSFKVLSGRLADVSIMFKVFDFDRFGADSLIGQLTMYMKDINMKTMINVLSEFSKDLEPGEDTSSGMGQICVILNNNHQGLQVTVLEAKNIRIKENTNYSHIFVSVKLKIRKKSRTFRTFAKKRTKDCSCMRFPYFNEAFLFHNVPVSICDCQISLKLWLTGPFKMAHCIGYVSLGSDVSKKSGEIHWKSMLDNPRHPVAKWHILTSPNVKET